MVWMLIMTPVFWFDLYMTPILMIWPVLWEKVEAFVWLCDFCWIVNIAFSFVLIRHEHTAAIPQQIFMDYFSGMFPIDVLAIFIPIFAGHHTSL